MNKHDALQALAEITNRLTPEARAESALQVDQVIDFFNACPNEDTQRELAKLDTIRDLIEDLSGKPSHEELLDALQKVSDLVGAQELGAEDAPPATEPPKE